MQTQADIRKLLDKFRQRTCTPEEVARIGEYLRDNEHQLLLLLEEDWQSFQTNDRLDETRSQRIFEAITAVEGPVKARSRFRDFSFERTAIKWLLPGTAAAILWLTLSYFLWRPIQYATSDRWQEIVLPDSSAVTLNARSQLIYHRSLLGRTRQVTLHGEAFFRVARNPDKPFAITTHRAVVQVLGTQFNVKENPADSTVWVAVTEGLVSFHRREDPASQSIRLTRNQLGQLHRNGRIVTEYGPVVNYLTWMPHTRLTFQGTPLPEVVRQLERVYGIAFELRGESLARLRLTASTHKDSLPLLLGKMALSLNIRYRLEPNKVILIP